MIPLLSGLIHTLEWQSQLDRTSVVRTKCLCKMCSQVIAMLNIHLLMHVVCMHGLVAFAVHCILHVLFLCSMMKVPLGV